MDIFLDGVRNFIAFWTVKHIAVLLFILVCLVLVCSPHHDTAEPHDCSGDSCPSRHK